MRGTEHCFAGTRRFDLRGRLGGGGGGVVYRAFDRERECEVALKLMHRDEVEDRAALHERIRALARLSHPNLVRLHELVDEGRELLLSMELIEGVELLHYVGASGQAEHVFDELRLRATLAQLAQGLSALHAARKVHRDVKPANVRVTAQGRLVLLDLDLALDLDAERSARVLGRTPRPVGTALYMAPEQAVAQRLGPASDWYSMGVVLYQALTGVCPWSGSDLAVLLEKQQRRPPPPGTLVPELPGDLAELCMDLLAPDPAHRPTGPEILRRLSVREDALSARWTAASLLTVHPPFLGREVELAQLERAVDDVRRGTKVVRVVGEAGVGKSALCEAALRRATELEPRLLVLRGVCSRYPDKPHAPLREPIARLVQALRERRGNGRLQISGGALRLLERAFPGVMVGLEAAHQGRTAQPPDPLEQRWRAIAAISAILREIARAGPVALWLDDYQWADADTQRFVRALVEGSDAPPFLLLLSQEPEPGALGPPCLRAHETIELAELCPRDADALLAELCELAGSARSDVERGWHAQPGPCTPLQVIERTRQLLLFSSGDGTDLTSLYAQRVRQLSEPLRRVLELVCAAFDATPSAIHERASELSVAAFAEHVAALRVAGLVRSLSSHGEDALVPGHSLVAELVDLELVGPRRVSIHQRLANALMARDGVRASGRLLRHQGESGDQARAAESAERAAEQAHDALAFQRAAELFTLRASLEPPACDARGHRSLRRTAEALTTAGWALAAATVYRDAAECASAADALLMRQRTLECLIRGGQLEESEQPLRELLVELGQPPLTPSRAYWSLLRARLGMNLFGFGFREQSEQQISPLELGKVDALFAISGQLARSDGLLGAALRARALEAARAIGEPKRVARSLCAEAWSQVGAPKRERTDARSLLEAARNLTERYDAPSLAGHIRLAQGISALARHQMREVSTHCRDAERVFRDCCADAGWELGLAQVNQLLALSTMGHYAELTPTLARYRREAEERGDEWTYSALLGVEAMGAALAADDPELSEAHVREARSRWRARKTLHAQALFNTIARTACDLYRRDERADAKLDERLHELDLGQYLRVRFLRVNLLELRARARLSAAARRRDPARLRAVELDARRLIAERTPSAIGFGQLLLANAHHARGDDARASSALERGIAELEPLGLDPWVICARLALGQLRADERGKTESGLARTQLELCGVRCPDRFLTTMLPAFSAD